MALLKFNGVDGFSEGVRCVIDHPNFRSFGIFVLDQYVGNGVFLAHAENYEHVHATVSHHLLDQVGDLQPIDILLECGNG